MNLEVYKYVALQLLALSGLIDEDLKQTPGVYATKGVLPISFSKSVLPNNLAELIADAERRVSVAQLNPPTPNAQPAAVPPLAAPAPDLAKQSAPPVASSAVAPAPPKSLAITPAPVAHVSPPIGRRRRSVAEIVNAVAGTTADVANAVADSHLALVPGVAAVADTVGNVAEVVDDSIRVYDYPSLSTRVIDPVVVAS